MPGPEGAAEGIEDAALDLVHDAGRQLLVTQRGGVIGVPFGQSVHGDIMPPEDRMTNDEDQ